jgi:hypothetical protein
VRDLSLIGAAAAVIALVVDDIRPLNPTPNTNDLAQAPDLRLGWVVSADTGRRLRPATPADLAPADASESAGYAGVFAYYRDYTNPDGFVVLPDDPDAMTGYQLWVCLQAEDRYLPALRQLRQTIVEPELLVDAGSTAES